MKSYIIHPAPFPLPFDVVDNWSNIIRNNKFYYVEGVEPGNIILVNKHDIVEKVLEIKEAINKDEDPERYHTILVDSLGGEIKYGNGVGVPEQDDSIISLIYFDERDEREYEYFLLCEEKHND